MFRRKILSFPLLSTFLLYANLAIGDVLFTTGSLTEVSAPSSLLVGAFESSTEIVIIDEGTTLLPGDVVVNAFGPGVHTGSLASITAIPAGTLVHSYFVHFDPVGTFFTSLTGAVFFDPGEIILGIQTHSPLLDFTDPVVGIPATSYPTGSTTRGFDTLLGTDTVTIMPGLGSASFAFFAELGVDQARIFTATAVPESSSILLGAFGAIGATLIARHRRKCRAIG